MDAAMWVN